MSGSLYPPGQIDPSIILRAGQGVQQPTNLLAQAGQLYQLRGNMLAQRAQQAIGQAYQQATDPTTGVVDQGRFRALVAADPTAAYGAADAGGASLAQQGATLTNETQTLQNQGRKIGFLAGLAAPLAADPNVSMADVTSTIKHAVQFGLVDNGTAQAMLTSVGNNPAGVRGALGQFLKAQMAPSEEYGHIYGTNAQLDNGPTLQSGTMAPADQGGGFVPGTVTPLGISPPAAATQVNSVDAQGRPIAGTLGGRLQAQGAGNLVSPGPTQRVIPGADKYPFTPGGSYPQQPPAAPPPVQRSPGFPPVGTPGALPGGAPQQQPAAAPATPFGTVAVGPAAGDVEAQAATKQAGAQDAAALVRAAQDSPNRKAVLGNMLSDLSNFSSGGGWGATGRGFLAKVNATLGTNFDGEGIQAAQSFDKFAAQIANAQAGALGAGTDAKLASAMHANPNSSLSTATNTQMIHTLMGNEDAINAKAKAWQQAQANGVSPGSYQYWSQAFNEHFDPRAYQLLRMSPEERTSMQAEMAKTGQLDDFKAAVRAMGAAGLLPLPAAPGQTPGQAGPQVPTGG